MAFYSALSDVCLPACHQATPTTAYIHAYIILSALYSYFELAPPCVSCHHKQVGLIGVLLLECITSMKTNCVRIINGNSRNRKKHPVRLTSTRFLGHYSTPLYHHTVKYSSTTVVERSGLEAMDKYFTLRVLHPTCVRC